MISERIIKESKKRRRCYWCGEIIEIGQGAVREFCVGPGYPGNIFFHPECHEAMKGLSSKEWKEYSDSADDTLPEYFFLRGSNLPKDERERL